MVILLTCYDLFNNLKNEGYEGRKCCQKNVHNDHNVFMYFFCNACQGMKPACITKIGIHCLNV